MKNPTEPVVALILYNPESKLFLVQRHKSGKWGFMTGRIEEQDFLDDPFTIGDAKPEAVTAVIREAKEELGIDLNIKRLEYLGAVYPKSQYPGHNGERFEASVFIAPYAEREEYYGKIVNMEPETCLELKWWTDFEIETAARLNLTRVTTTEIVLS